MTEEISSIDRTWIWIVESQVRAVVLNLESNLLEWHDNVGSKCGDDGADFHQSVDEFLESGAPFPHVPSSDLSEIRAQLRRSASATNEH